MLHNEELHSLYRSPNIKILTGTSAEKRPLGRPRRRWEDNIRMNLKEIKSIRGIGLIQLRIAIIGEPL